MPATFFSSCGCSVTSEMFGSRPIITISLCLNHAQDEELQDRMVEARKRLAAIMSAEDGEKAEDEPEE